MQLLEHRQESNKACDSDTVLSFVIEPYIVEAITLNEKVSVRSKW